MEQAFYPLTFLVVAVTLGTVGVAASTLPAWRAATISPVQAMRAE